MKNLRKSVFILILLFLSSSLYAQELSVVINKDVGVKEVSLKELKDIFKNKKKLWENGTKVKIALMSTKSAVGKLTADKVYGMSTKALKKFWLALVFQGKAAAPKYFDSEAGLTLYVKSNAGAIGLIGSDGVTDATVLKVDGKTKF